MPKSAQRVDTMKIPTDTFESFPKMSRLFRDVIVTEKIDGTNAQVFVTEDGAVYAGSRNRWITPEADNFGFAKWVHAHTKELSEGLGPGRHFGEWWGSGIQRGYGLEKGEKRFSLFNTHRWGESRPECCHVVPVLYEGPLSSSALRGFLLVLDASGSKAAPGFMKPEGIVIFHTASNTCFKVTLDGDGHKGAE